MQRQLTKIEKKLNITTGELPPCYLLFPKGKGHVDQNGTYHDRKAVVELKKHNRLIFFEDAN